MPNTNVTPNGLLHNIQVCLQSKANNESSKVNVAYTIYANVISKLIMTKFGSYNVVLRDDLLFAYISALYKHFVAPILVDEKMSC